MQHGAADDAHDPEPVDAGTGPLDFDAVEELGRERGEEFIRLFNEIDHFIKRMTSSSGSEGFFRRLQWATRNHPELKRYSDDLLEFAELRNALVHDRQFPGKVIAVPTAETLIHFRRIVERITRPRRVIPTFASDLRVFQPEEPLSAALEYMHQRGFTQIVAREQRDLKLLTAAGITRWLAAQLDGPAPIGADHAPPPGGICIDLAGATIGDALALEKPDALGLIAADATLEEAIEAFQRAVATRHGRLFALLITEHARPSEPPLGIITPADLLEDD